MKKNIPQKTIREVNGVSDRLRHEMLLYEGRLQEEHPNIGELYGTIAPLKVGQTIRGVSIE
jgi:hypothetical protein